MDHLGSAGWNLMIDRRCEDVLHVAPVDSLSIPINHCCCQSRGIRIDRAVGLRLLDQPAGGKWPSAIGRGELHPDLVGIDRALRKVVANCQRPHHHLNQIGLTWGQRGQLRSDRSLQHSICSSSLLEAEDVDPQLAVETAGLCAAQERSMGGSCSLKPLRFLWLLSCSCEHGRKGRVCRREEMVMHRGDCCSGKELSSRVITRGQRHVTDVAVLAGSGGVVEAAGTMSRNPGKQK